MKRQETLTNAIHHATTKVWLSSLALVASLAMSSPTYGLAININASSALSANTAALNAFNRAADRWESIFSDPITVTIDADIYDFGGSNSLGKTSSMNDPAASCGVSKARWYAASCGEWTRRDSTSWFL